MNYKLFLSTFVLIFLAELGDKTQLAAMAKVAEGGGGKWTVFVAASAALVLSTLIAVLLGDKVTRFVPDVYIKTAAGALFVILGVAMLIQAFSPAAAAARGAAKPGTAARLILRVAAEFEAAAIEDYNRLAEQSDDPAAREVMLAIARAEEKHLERLRLLERDHGESMIEAELGALSPAREALLHDVSEKARPVIEHAIEHEEATVQFYEELSRGARLPTLKRVFASLAEEERSHVRELQSLV